MESPYHNSSPVSHASGSRPSLGFPLGTALLLVVVFSLSGIFSCCYHWDKFRRTLALGSPDIEAAANHGILKPKAIHTSVKQKQSRSLLPVIMPGDTVPKFIALACPCDPPRPARANVVEVSKSSVKPSPVAASLC